MAMVLARSTSRLVRWARPLILLPLVLPPVVGGIALLYAFGRLGLLGRYLDAAGIQIAFSTTAVVLAQTFVSLPFLVDRAGGGCAHRGRRLRGGRRHPRRPADRGVVAGDAAAAGAGLASGAVLAFARSLGEFGATLTFAGSREGVTRTLPLEIYLQREVDADAAVALSVLLVVVAAVVVIGVGSRRLGAGGASGWQ